MWECREGDSEVSLWEEGARLYPHLRFTAQAYVTGWRVRGESVGGGCETVSPSMVRCVDLCDRVESQR